MRNAITLIATISGLSILRDTAGEIWSIWAASVLLAFCIGAFWAAGEQKRKATP